MMISELFAKHQFSAKHAADITDGKVTNRVVCSAAYTTTLLRIIYDTIICLLWT